MKNIGFTLIELLAVILILGIIALIAVPVVNDVLTESKMGAFKSTVNNLTKKIEENCSMDIIKGNSITFNYQIVDGIPSTDIELKGDIPDGEISVNSDCEVTYELTNNGFNAIKSDPDGEVKINKCKGNCLSYNESILNGAKPSLDSGMIPVVIENNGTVKKADIYSEWYSYEDKKWANVVLVTDESRDIYKEANVGSTVNSSDILGYFVWIPRYKYRISTGGTTTPSSIDIIFENRFEGKSNGNATTEYYTHPGFTFGNKELNGIWVAKFETTGSAVAPTVLPNTTSLRGQNIKEEFETAKIFNDYVTTSDSHMMKNIEWGAVAYLSHSTYGINGKIRINNNSGLVTGCGATAEEGLISDVCEISYGSGTNDLPQSTTGNINGVFDMSGGSWERVMGNYNNFLTSSGFVNMPDKKYYDLYKTRDYNTACEDKQCLGHANSETESWHDNRFVPIDASSSWIGRGGSFDNEKYAGAFYTSKSTGSVGSSSTFRITITN